MALDSYTYGTVDRVERMVGDIVSGHQFGVSTVPDAAGIEIFLDDAASEIHGRMALAGYAPLTAAATLAAAPLAFNWLRNVNSLGGACKALASKSSEVSYAQDPGSAGSRGGTVCGSYKALLDEIAEGVLGQLGLPLDTATSTEGLASGVTTVPRFFRDWTNLTEPA